MAVAAMFHHWEHSLLNGIHYLHMKEMLYAVRCLKSNEDMILALAGQFK